VDGYIGLTDFRGEVIRAFHDAGWIFYGEVTIWKNPQAQSLRTKAHALTFQSKNRDSAGIRPALADYLLIFKKPGDNAVKIPHDVTTGEVTNDDWIEWASPIWYDRNTTADDLGGDGLSPVWTTIRETKTLNERAGREADDERHLCPLQLDFIERCVRLWSNPGETVLTPFAGIGSEVYMAVKLGRRGTGIELKASYWQAAVNNLRALEAEKEQGALFGADGI
jgi:DNA modification methylase